MGTPDFAVGTLEAIQKAGHEVIGVVTQPDRPRGRGKKLHPTPVKSVAVSHNLPIYQPVKVRAPEFVETLKHLKPDVVVVAAFGQIIPQSILDIPTFGCLNVHASLLPKYRGAAPIQWAVIDGERESGVTIMQMNAGLDTGDILSKAIVPLDAGETGGSLFDKLSKAGARLLVDTLIKLENGQITPLKQPKESPTKYARMIKKSDGLIDWSKDAVEIERLIRGMNPWPSAYTHLSGKTLKIWKASTSDEMTKAEGTKKPDIDPGTVTGTDEVSIRVQTGDGEIRLLEIQMEGKKRMTCDAFLRGYEVIPGTRLGI